MSYRTLLGAAFFLAVLSCTHPEKIPADILPPTVMKGVLVDMLEASAYANVSIRMDSGQKRENTEKVLYGQILLLHRISQGEFMKSYDYYESHPDKMQQLYTAMSASLGLQTHVVDSMMVVSVDSTRRAKIDSVARARKDSLGRLGISARKGKMDAITREKMDSLLRIGLGLRSKNRKN